MPDYIYLLENRLSADQRNALRVLRESAVEAGMLLFLTGDAVRDLTSGHAVRELEVVVHGNALKLKKAIEKAGGKIWGEDETSHTLYLCFPGTVRVDLVSAHGTEYPKPGKPVYHWATIQEDLRRRDFTVNAMAISLNEGSFGLLMDPLNGAADIEARSLRLVSNYGFLEEPALLIRATRYKARLSWELDSRTQTRYENAKGENVIEFLSAQARSEELEQIGHEEDALKVLEALEAEGWMKVLFPSWTAAKADVEGLKTLHDQAVELLMQGVHADMSAAQMQLLTAKLGSKDTAALKKMFIRQGFVDEWNSLDSLASGFAKALNAKENQTPSACFKLFRSYDPEAILWLGFTTENASIRERYNLFLKVWPEARQKIPYVLMQEMRITPELPAYNQIIESIYLELIDGKLTTPEEMRAFLEPHSPPAPPPQVTIKRTRAKRGAEPKVKERDLDDDEDSEDSLDDEDEGLDDIAGDDEEIDLGIPIPKVDLEADDEEEEVEESEAEDELDDDDDAPAPKRGSKAGSAKPAKETPTLGKPGSGKAASGIKDKPGAAVASVHAGKPGKEAPAKPAPKSEPPAKAPAPSKTALPAKVAAAPVAPTKGKPAPVVKQPPAPAKPADKSAGAKSAAKPPAKSIAKPALKAPAKQPAKPATKPAPAKAAKSHPPAKPAAKKPAPKPPAKKR